MYKHAQMSEPMHHDSTDSTDSTDTKHVEVEVVSAVERLGFWKRVAHMCSCCCRRRHRRNSKPLEMKRLEEKE